MTARGMWWRRPLAARLVAIVAWLLAPAAQEVR